MKPDTKGIRISFICTWLTMVTLGEEVHKFIELYNHVMKDFLVCL